VVQEVPPLFAAGVRFFIAGLALYGFMRLRGEAAPAAKQWRNMLVMSLLMFVADYAALFWAEKYIPSGIAAVLLATIPLLTLVMEIVLLPRHRLSWMVVASALIGFGGVLILLLPGKQTNLEILPCLAILGGATAWALGIVLSRSMDLPKARPMTSGVTMLLGGTILLLLSGATGELHRLSHFSLRAVLAEGYLIVFGSLIAFTAFVWLLAHMPATSVSSYAYVNPVVAVALGYFLGGEALTLRSLAGTALVVTSVILILRPARQES
jgi:drug/metabolite transporter (DMT)-like permease